MEQTCPATRPYAPRPRKFWKHVTIRYIFRPYSFEIVFFHTILKFKAISLRSFLPLSSKLGIFDFKFEFCDECPPLGLIFMTRIWNPGQKLWKCTQDGNSNATPLPPLSGLGFLVFLGVLAGVSRQILQK